MNTKILGSGCISFLLCFSVFAATTDMTFEEYETQLANSQQREKSVKEELAVEQGKIEALKQEISDVDQRLSSVVQEKYAILGITEQDITAAEAEAEAIRQQIELLMGLMPDELSKRIGDIKKIEGRIAAFKSQKVSYLYRIANKISEIESLLDQLKTRMKQNESAAAAQQAQQSSSSYTVRLIPDKRDCLYRIARYENVYNDPSQWPRIYQANKSLIDKDFNRYKNHSSDSKYSRPEDLIFPGQVLDIPR